MPYGVAENVHTTATCPSLKENTSRPVVSISDRIHHLEAFILSFAAENSLPLSTVPKLIEFSQFLARDPKALSQLQMNRTAATYKLKHGLLVYVRKNVVECMKKYPFSIDIDECTSNNSHKVFTGADSGLVKLVVMTNVFFNNQQHKIKIKRFLCDKEVTSIVSSATGEINVSIHSICKT